MKAASHLQLHQRVLSLSYVYSISRWVQSHKFDFAPRPRNWISELNKRSSCFSPWALKRRLTRTGHFSKICLLTLLLLTSVSFLAPPLCLSLGHFFGLTSLLKERKKKKHAEGRSLHRPPWGVDISNLAHIQRHGVDGLHYYPGQDAFLWRKDGTIQDRKHSSITALSCQSVWTVAVSAWQPVNTVVHGINILEVHAYLRF